MAGGLVQLPANCAPCQQLQTTLQNCQACGQDCGTCKSTGNCPAGEHTPPCGPNEITDPQTGCCEPSQCVCGAGDYNLPAGTPCPAGTMRDPAFPQCDCCKPIATVCPTGEHQPPCQANETIDPASGCCQKGQNVCPAGDYNVGPGQACPQGTIQDPSAPPGCCKPVISQCPTGDVPAIPSGQGFACQAGYVIDPTTPPNAPCCKPSPCPPNDLPMPCTVGYAPDPQAPNCCAPEPVEACFVCPGGLPDLANALSGRANTCYLYSQQFLPFGQLPAPGGGLPAAM